MACMQNVCRDCSNEWFDNTSGAVCVKCGSTNVAHYWDEVDDDGIDFIDDGT